MDEKKRKKQQEKKRWELGFSFSLDDGCCGEDGCKHRKGQRKWLLKGFIGLDYTPGAITHSPLLKVAGRGVRLHVRPGGIARPTRELQLPPTERRMAVYVSNEDHSPLRCKLGIMFEDPDGKELYGLCSEGTITIPSPSSADPMPSYGWPALPLTRKTLESAFLFDGNLFLGLELEVFSLGESAPPISSSSCGALHTDMANLLSSGTGDVKFSIRGSTLSAHRFLLSGRSPVFKVGNVCRGR